MRKKIFQFSQWQKERRGLLDGTFVKRWPRYQGPENNANFRINDQYILANYVDQLARKSSDLCQTEDRDQKRFLGAHSINFPAIFWSCRQFQARTFSDLMKSAPAHHPAQPPQGYPRIGWLGGVVGWRRVNLIWKCSSKRNKKSEAHGLTMRRRSRLMVSFGSASRHPFRVSGLCSFLRRLRHPTKQFVTSWLAELQAIASARPGSACLETISKSLSEK